MTWPAKLAQVDEEMHDKGQFDPTQVNPFDGEVKKAEPKKVGFEESIFYIPIILYVPG